MYKMLTPYLERYSVNLFSLKNLFFLLIFTTIILVSYYLIFEKAGEMGLKCIIPFYNQYILYKISWDCGWIFLISYIPFIGWFVSFIMKYKLSRRFGYGFLFTLGLYIFPFIFLPILGFSRTSYQKR